MAVLAFMFLRFGKFGVFFSLVMRKIFVLWASILFTQAALDGEGLEQNWNQHACSTFVDLDLA